MKAQATKIYGFLVLLFFTSLPFHLRVNNSVFIVLIVFWFLSGQWVNLKKLFKGNAIVWSLIIFFAVNALGLFNTENMDLAWFNLDKKLQLVLFPVFLGTYFVQQNGKKALLVFGLSVLASSAYCLAAASLSYFQDGNSEVFFYHALSNQIGNSAIYQSLFTLWAILLFAHWKISGASLFAFPRKLLNAVILFLCFSLFLLSSKSLILLGIGFAVFGALRFLPYRWPLKIIGTSAILLTLVIAISMSPLANRFQDILESKLEVVMQTEFQYNSDFDGLNMRLTFWRFAFEILNDEEAWFMGVGPGDSQALLVKKYEDYRIYLGNPNLGDIGYRKTNTHNQWVESALKSGILGILSLFLIFILLVQRAYNASDILLLGFAILFAWLMMSESVFERQKGLSLFCSIILILRASVQKKSVSGMQT